MWGGNGNLYLGPANEHPSPMRLTEGNTMKYRQAILAVSNELWETLTSALCSYTYSSIAKKLKLPDDCKIVGISYEALFDRNQVAVKIEAPYFPETEPGHALPMVDAIFNEKGFVRWEYSTKVLLGIDWWGHSLIQGVRLGHRVREGDEKAVNFDSYRDQPPAKISGVVKPVHRDVLVNNAEARYITAYMDMVQEGPLTPLQAFGQFVYSCDLKPTDNGPAILTYCEQGKWLVMPFSRITKVDGMAVEWKSQGLFHIFDRYAEAKAEYDKVMNKTNTGMKSTSGLDLPGAVVTENGVQAPWTPEPASIVDSTLTWDYEPDGFVIPSPVKGKLQELVDNEEAIEVESSTFMYPPDRKWGDDVIRMNDKLTDGEQLKDKPTCTCPRDVVVNRGCQCGGQ